MKKQIIILLGLAFCLCVMPTHAFAVNIIMEDFSLGGFESGWATNGWEVNTNSASNFTGGIGNFASADMMTYDEIINPTHDPLDGYDVWLQSAIYTLSSTYIDYDISFQMSFVEIPYGDPGGDGDSGYFEYKSSSLSDWQTLAMWENVELDHELITLDLTSQLTGLSDVQFRWAYRANEPVEYWSFAIDDILLTADTGTITPPVTDPVPEPGTLVILGCGALGVFGYRKYKAKK